MIVSENFRPGLQLMTNCIVFYLFLTYYSTLSSMSKLEVKILAVAYFTTFSTVSDSDKENDTIYSIQN